MGGLVLYFREGCHLCDDMRRELYPYVQKNNIPLLEIDIDSDQKLTDKYTLKVPVLCKDDEEICHYFFDLDMVKKYVD